MSTKGRSPAFRDRPPLYRIVDWDAHCETSDTRKYKHLTWIKLPNKMDGDGYTTVVLTGRGMRGAALYGAWNTLLLVASRCEPRGTLIQACGEPHDPGSLSRRTRLPKSLYVSLLPLLVTIGWIEVVAESPGTPGDQPGAPGDAPALARARQGRVGEVREGEGGIPPTPQVVDGERDWRDGWIDDAQKHWPKLEREAPLREYLAGIDEQLAERALIQLALRGGMGDWGPDVAKLASACSDACDAMRAASRPLPTEEEMALTGEYTKTLAPEDYKAFCDLAGIVGGREEQRKRVKEWDAKRKEAG